MSNELLQRVKNANANILRYSLKLQKLENSKYVSIGEVDVENQASHFITTLGTENTKSVEYYWIQGKAYGKPAHLQSWFNVWVPGPPASPLHAMLPWLDSVDLKNITKGVIEHEEFWILPIKLDCRLLRERSDDFVDKVLRGLSEQTRKEINRLNNLKSELSQAEVDAKCFISVLDYSIRKIDVYAHTPKSEEHFEFYISNINSPNLQIEAPQAALDTEGDLMSYGLLFIKPPKWGWSEYNHCKMTEIALRLIKIYDDKKQYEEIYENGKIDTYYYQKQVNGSLSDHPDEKSHPCVLGAWAEDAWNEERLTNRFGYDSSLSVKKFRSFHHFGDVGEGLKWESYFKLIDSEVPEPKNDRYISAVEWGSEDGFAHKEAGVSGDKMNFKGAIEAYNLSSPDGKKEAYIRMGHVLHLLQDLAQPDHAHSKHHAASSMDEKEAFETMYVCEARAATIIEHGLPACAAFGFLSPLCIAGVLIAAGIEEAACRDYENEVGFEKLIKDKWSDVDPDVSLNFKQYLEHNENNYTTIFSNLISDVKEATLLPLPLGLGSVTLSPLGAAVIDIAKGGGIVPYETIPGVDPDIDITDPKEVAPYIQLAQKVVSMAIMRSAALLQLFYEIVNPPPIVERIVAMKGIPGMEPTGFAEFSQGSSHTHCSFSQIKYDARWEQVGTRRMKVIETNLPLSSSHAVYVFILFGPHSLTGKSKRMDRNSVSLKLTSLQGELQQPDVRMYQGYDESVGEYYWGSFNPPNQSTGNYEIWFEINGQDATAHRAEKNTWIDSDPASIAIVDTERIVGDVIYPFKNYDPGKDRNHSIFVAPRILDDQFESNDSFYQARSLPLTNLQGKSDKLSMKRLTLSHSSDIDYFWISFTSNPEEDFSGYHAREIAGLVFHFYPPNIQISVAEEFGSCLALSVFRTNQSLYKDYGITNHIQIDSPVIELGSQKSFYLVVKNPDFNRQGLLRYNLDVRYNPVEGDVSGKLLYEFWKYTNPPYPPRGYEVLGDPPDVIVYRDIELLVNHLVQFSPQLELEFHNNLSPNGAERIQLRSDIARIAYIAHQYDYAAEMFRQCSNEFIAEGLFAEATNSLLALRELYYCRDLTNKADEVSTEISQLMPRIE
jgi:hypothetical protein